MDDASLIEICISSRTVSDRILDFKRDTVRLPSGREGVREYIAHPGAVIILPLLANGNVVLERQFRYPLRRVMIELPAGKIDAGEDPQTAAARELLEETGYEAKTWVSLGAQHPCIGYSNEIIHIYLAKDLQLKTRQPEEDEALIVFEASFAECMRMVMQGEITDGKTMIALLLAEKCLAEK